MKKVLLLVGAALVMSACGEVTAPTAAKKAPSARSSHDEIFCESGYVIAYDENGNPVCVPDPNGGTSSFRAGGGLSGTSGSSGSSTPPGGL